MFGTGRAIRSWSVRPRVERGNVLEVLKETKKGAETMFHRRWCARIHRWEVWVGLFLLASAMTAGAMISHAAVPGNSGQAAAVQAATTSAAESGGAASPRAPRPEAVEHGTNFAESLSAAFHNASEQVLPSVVTITNTFTRETQTKDRRAVPDEGDDEESDPFEGTPFGEFFRGNPELRHFFREIPQMPSVPRPEAKGTGSGVIIDSSGVVLTNNHVVDGGKVTVRLADGREFSAKEVKTDPRTDLAVVRIEGSEPFKAAKLGDSDAVTVGDWVLALGQPFGLEGTVTAGIISAKGRGLGIAPRENFLQTDAAINPGNSGGPLVNLRGEVIGINTAISTRNGGYQGVGFAIPVNLAKWVSQQLVEKGKVQRAYLGIVIQPVTQQLAEQFGVKVREGALVTEVPNNTPASKAGLKAGDIIVEFAGKTVHNPQDLQGVVEESKIGTSQPLVVVRDGKRLTLSATPGEQPADYGLARGGRGSLNGAERSRFDKLGIQAKTLTAPRAKELGVKAEHGVEITEVPPGSLADQAGLEKGMVIVEANRKPVRSTDDLRNAVEKQSLEKGLLLLVQSERGSRFVVIRVQE